ncbi:MAG: YlmC/YmxH family sporulation protein [Moorella humiferrea]|uniref:PRC-barrel domain protein n=1 Tax=Neomoorella humiferrea TaxID=676965 RepID=A0A2T0AN55_9FIRM|nr:YlmC/YmxH family sporulation protein [Moorella humiferrea]MBE3573488.1 YlmC/YmxH family sporulation protein [Moorella humiferrea]PRR70182.1 PRC-barrel domain protein [Moorella humiferrea]
MIRVTELRQREVINIIDGRRLGIIKDLDLDLEAGRVKALIVPGQGGRFFFFFGREEDLVIPWENVVKVGVDVILVESYNFTTPAHRERA